MLQSTIISELNIWSGMDILHQVAHKAISPMIFVGAPGVGVHGSKWQGLEKEVL